jgi:hypothetical protein
MAALDVVKSRLTRAGLDPFVLELHSDKTSKKHVLQELAKRLQYQPTSPADLPRKLQAIEACRNDLRDYCDLINSTSHSSLGRTLHQIMWRAERYRMTLSIDYRPLLQHPIAGAREMSELELSRRLDCLRHLGSQFAITGKFDAECPFWGFFPDPIIPGEELRLCEIFRASHEWAGRFLQSTRDYESVLESRAFGITSEDIAAQIRALEEITAKADTRLPLDLMPRLFRDDVCGRRAEQKLRMFVAQVEYYQNFGPIVAQALREEDAVTPERLEALRTLDHIAAQFGLALKKQADMRDLCAELHKQCEYLGVALTAIEVFCRENGIPFDGSRNCLIVLAKLAQAIMDAPEELLRFQHPGLTDDGACEAIEALIRLQHEWTALARELDAVLYLDALPPEAALRQAILTFREGGAWYRIFQGRWRAALTIHKTLQRTKQRLPVQQRLEELERLNALLQLKERWRNDPAWFQYVGCAAPAGPVALEGYLTLAAWNRSVQLLLEEVGAPVIVPAELTPDKIRALRRSFTAFSTHLASAQAALNTIDTLLPSLAAMPGGMAIATCRERADAFRAAIETQLPWLEHYALPDVPLSVCCRASEAALAVIFQQVVHSVRTGQAEAADTLASLGGPNGHP